MSFKPEQAVEQSIASLTLGAVGDALGAPIEFHSHLRIVNRHGPGGLDDYGRAYGKLGAITDDTQMTLSAADSLLRATNGDYRTSLAYGYLAWLETQGYRNPEYPNMLATYDTELYQKMAEQGPRAPGDTCLSALRAITQPIHAARNQSKGCGTVMRTAPIGLYFGSRADELTDDVRKAIHWRGIEDAELTHGHMTAQQASGVLANIIAGCLHGEDLAETAEAALGLCYDNATLHACARATESAQSDPSYETLKALGRGHIAEEALAIGLYTALQHAAGRLSTKAALLLAVNHSGDSDSTGAIAGNIIGVNLANVGQSIDPELLPDNTEVGSLTSLFEVYGERLILG